MTTQLLCPCDEHATLKLGTLAPGLAALACEVCDGRLLELDDYRAWASAEMVVTDAVDSVFDLGEDGPNARRCPSCTRFMQRLRTDSGDGFRVDRCNGCQLVWLDRGEWTALIHSGHATQLTSLMSDGTQRQLQADELRAMRLDALRTKHGDECLKELQRMRDWLLRQSEPDELLNLLRAGW